MDLRAGFNAAVYDLLFWKDVPEKWFHAALMPAPQASTLRFIISVAEQDPKNYGHEHTVVDTVQRCTQFLYSRIIPHIDTVHSHFEVV